MKNIIITKMKKKRKRGKKKIIELKVRLKGDGKTRRIRGGRDACVESNYVESYLKLSVTSFIKITGMAASHIAKPA